jgi:hypothetical protein
MRENSRLAASSPPRAAIFRHDSGASPECLFTSLNAD